MSAPVVIVYPLSGYVNRIQAIASAWIISQSIGAEFIVCWQEQEVAPATAHEVFAKSFVDAHIISTSEAGMKFGIDFAEVPYYLTVDELERTVFVRGHDRGEQYFMPQLRAVMAAMPEISTLVFIAGGKFDALGAGVLDESQAVQFRIRRQAAYQEMQLHPAIEATAREQTHEHGSFLGLHLRYSDRNHQAPTIREINRALVQIWDRSQTNSLFVASDTPSARGSWMRRAKDLGLDAWSFDAQHYPRSDARGAHGALIDWRILGRSQSMVYFAASSFAEEAAVASGHYADSVGLATSVSRSVVVKGRRYVDSLLTYPWRHGWLGRG